MMKLEIPIESVNYGRAEVRMQTDWWFMVC